MKCPYCGGPVKKVKVPENARQYYPIDVVDHLVECKSCWIFLDGRKNYLPEEVLQEAGRVRPEEIEYFTGEDHNE